MIPELFEIPFLHVTVKSYGLMMVIGFLCAVFVMRRMAVKVGEEPDHITNVALYALITGVLGSRLFYVIHNFDQFKGDFFRIFAVWEGGLEFIGGVILAVIFLLSYLFIRKRSIPKFLDILVVGLMIGLSFGRVGCFLNGCCFGKPTEAACGVVFPYNSPSFRSQVYPDKDRGRDEAQLDLPAEYYGHHSADGNRWIESTEENKYDRSLYYLKPGEMLTDEQAHDVSPHGIYHSQKVHPTQLYSSVNALILSGILYLFWRKFRDKKIGCTFGLMFIMYGITRFILESIRDDNPFETGWWIIYRGGTISQNIGIYMVIIGVISFLVFWFRPVKETKKA